MNIPVVNKIYISEGFFQIKYPVSSLDTACIPRKKNSCIDISRKYGVSYNTFYYISSSPPLFYTIFAYGNVGLLQRTGPFAVGPLSGRPGMRVSVCTLMASPFLRLRSGSISTLDLMVACSSLGVLISVGF